MSYSYSRKSYTSTEDSKKKPLKDNSWIRKDVEEDEPVDRDPNFGRTILGRYNSKESLNSVETVETSSPKVRSPSTSVQALTKRFSTSQDELWKSSTLPSNYGQKTTSYTRSTSSSLKSNDPKTTTTTRVIKDGTTTESTITTTQSVSRSPVSKTPTKTDTFTERVFSDVKSSSKGTLYSPPTLTTKKMAENKLFDTLLPDNRSTSVSKTETVTVISGTDMDDTKTTTTTRTFSGVEDDLYDTLLPKSILSGTSDVSPTSVIKSSVITVESTKGDDIKTTSTTRTSSTAEDDLYDTLLPKSIKSDLSPVSSYNSSDDTTSTRTSSYTISSKSSYEYSTSPTVYTTTSSKDSRVDDLLANDPYLSKSSIKTVYSSPERTLLEKDLCSYCRKPFDSGAKMVLEDMKINCHASCFKCEVCNHTLGHLKAGDSLWIYRRSVHCDSCFDVTREKWRC